MINTIYIDFDNVIVQTSAQFLKFLHRVEGKIVHPHELVDWASVGNLAEQNLFQHPDFYATIKAYPKARHNIKKFIEAGWDVFIVTGFVPMSGVDMKISWVRDRMPWFDVENNFIVMNQKWKLDPERAWLVEDKVETLRKWPGEKICFEQPYNVEVRPDVTFFTKDWDAIYNILVGE